VHFMLYNLTPITPFWLDSMLVSSFASLYMAPCVWEMIY
jgi:hypothetical protein